MEGFESRVVDTCVLIETVQNNPVLKKVSRSVGGVA
jgi:hypothetical protein